MDKQPQSADASGLIRLKKYLITSLACLARLAKKIYKYVLGLLLFILITIVGIDLGISYSVRNNVYTDIEKLPNMPYGLVLGTSKYYSKNKLNMFYKNRITAATNLYLHNKIIYLLLSGDNRSINYNEPLTMFKDLVKMQVPEHILYSDYAGFRTLDSIIRAQKIFNLDNITVISQKFHCERALLIAKYYDINAICFVAEDPEMKNFLYVRMRESLARLIVLLDLYVFNNQPYFLGEPEPLPQFKQLEIE